MADLVTFASVTGLNFFKESFDKQGFTDTSFEAWPHVKGGDGTRHILTNTGHLRDSTQILERSIQQIVFANTAIYADVHNNGGTINVKVTEKARKYFWYLYYTQVDKQGNILPGGSPTYAKMYKSMALTRKSFLTIKIPQRKFLGESKALMDIINAWAAGQAVTRFNNL
jgi:phage gpG-like protein